MGSETFSDFLIPLKFTLDEPSKKKFDAAVGEVEKKFAAIGAAAGTAAVALAFAVKEISKNLAQLAYSGERVGATTEEIKALGTAADRLGLKQEALSSLSKFFEFVNFEGGASVIKQWFKVDLDDPKHPLKAMLDSAVKLSDEYAKGTVAQRQTAIIEARRAGVDEKLLTTPGAARTIRDEMAKDEAFTGGKLNPIAEKAKRLNSEFEKVKQHLQDIGQLASGPLQDAFSHLLEKVDGWLKAHREGIIWFSNKAAEIADQLLMPNLKKFLEEITPNKQQKDDFLAFTKKISDAWKIVGDTYRSFWDGSIANKINAALEWAFQPFKWLWDKLQSLGIVAGSGYGPGGAASGGYGPGSGRGGEASLGGDEGGDGGSRGERGARGRASGQRGAIGGGARGGGRSGLTKRNKGKALHMMQRLIEKHGFTEEAAASAVGQVLTERPDFYTGDKGPKDAGSEGLFQWRLDRLSAGKRWAREQGRDWNDIDTQIDYFAEGPDPGRGVNMEEWKRTRSIEEGNRFGQQFERYRGGLQHHRARDAERIKKAYDELHKPSGASVQGDFHKRLEEIRAAKPLAPWQQSMTEHHDNRVVNSNVEVKVAGAFPVDKTARPLERSKNAMLIRNTTSTAA